MCSVVAQANNVDPTKPLTFKAGDVSIHPKYANENKKLTLEAIIHGKGIHTAVINNQKLQVGDRIGEYRLVAVNDNNAVLRSKTDKIRLHVFSGVIVK